MTPLQQTRFLSGEDFVRTPSSGSMSPGGWAAYTANSGKIYQQFLEQGRAQGMDRDAASMWAQQQYNQWGQAQHDQMYSDENAAPFGIKELAPLAGNNGLNAPLAILAAGSGGAAYGGWTPTTSATSLTAADTAGGLMPEYGTSAAYDAGVGGTGTGAGGLEQYGQLNADPYNGSTEWPDDSVAYNSNQPIESMRSPSITDEFGGPSSNLGPQPQIDMPDLSTITQPEIGYPEINIAEAPGLSPLQLASLGTSAAGLLKGTGGGDPSGGPDMGGDYDPSNPYGTGPTSTQWPDDSAPTTDIPSPDPGGQSLWDSIKNAGGDFEKLVKDYPTMSKLIGSAGLGGLAMFSNYQQAQNNQKMQQDAIARQQARQQVMDNPAPYTAMQGPGTKPFTSNGAAPTDLAHYGQGPEFNFSQPQQHAGGGRIHGGAGAPTGGLNAMRLVRGPGGGQDDKVPAMLSPSEYVFDAETVSHIGDGNPEEGARKLDEFRERLRAHKRSASTKKIPPKARPIDSYMRAA